MEDEDGEVRDQKIKALLDSEIEKADEFISGVRLHTEDYLLSLGYTPDQLQKDFAFNVKVGNELYRSSVDFVIRIFNESAMVVKCAAGSLDSRERHILAAARIMEPLPIPFALLMDPMNAILYNVITGEIIGESAMQIPSPQDLAKMLEEVNIEPLSEKRKEGESRIFIAFDIIKCRIAQGGQGGVSLE